MDPNLSNEKQQLTKQSQIRVHLVAVPELSVVLHDILQTHYRSCDMIKSSSTATKWTSWRDSKRLMSKFKSEWQLLNQHGGTENLFSQSASYYE